MTRKVDAEAYARRKAKALRMRQAGYNNFEIAQASQEWDLPYRDARRVSTELTRELKRIVREPAMEVIELELMRLDRATRAIWPAVKAGKLAAIDRMLAIMRQRARYLGLNYLDRAVAGNSDVDKWLQGLIDSDATPDPSVEEEEHAIARARERMAAT